MRYIANVFYILFMISLTICSCGSGFVHQNEAITQPQWYQGGTLHQATIQEWKSATAANQLATCADFVAAMKKTKGVRYTDLNVMRYDAEQLKDCMNEAIRGDEMNGLGLKANEIAAFCAVLMGY